MPGSLLKSSGWFLRPSHLKKTLADDPLPPSNFILPVQPSEPSVPPEEEFFIRKCCPVTLSHLLPDLYLTHKHQIEESSSEFDANMQIKLEKHFEESHSVLSCTNSSENEEEDGEIEDENKLEESIENDINFHILHKEKLKLPNKYLLKPHIVNYPEPDMKESILPRMKLNNKFSLPPKNQILPSALECAENIQRLYSGMDNFQLLDLPFRNTMVPFKNNRQIQPLLKSKNVSYVPSKKCKIATDQKVEKRCNAFDGNYSSLFQKTQTDFSFLNCRLTEDGLKRVTFHSPLTPQYSAHVHKSRPSLCIDHRRAKSLPPFKMKFPAHTRSPRLPETPDNLIMPSPHLLQLAKLKKEELELQEKMLIRQRQILELERLRSPEEKWYEMKNYRFHQEAHKNNVFLKNESCLPLIRERRQQLFDVVMNSH